MRMGHTIGGAPGGHRRTIPTRERRAPSKVVVVAVVAIVVVVAVVVVVLVASLALPSGSKTRSSDSKGLAMLSPLLLYLLLIHAVLCILLLFSLISFLCCRWCNTTYVCHDHMNPCISSAPLKNEELLPIHT